MNTTKQYMNLQELHNLYRYSLDDKIERIERGHVDFVHFGEQKIKRIFGDNGVCQNKDITFYKTKTLIVNDNTVILNDINHGTGDNVDNNYIIKNIRTSTDFESVTLQIGISAVETIYHELIPFYMKEYYQNDKSSNFENQFEFMGPMDIVRIILSYCFITIPFHMTSNMGGINHKLSMYHNKTLKFIRSKTETKPFEIHVDFYRNDKEIDENCWRFFITHKTYKHLISFGPLVNYIVIKSNYVVEDLKIKMDNNPAVSIPFYYKFNSNFYVFKLESTLHLRGLEDRKIYINDKEIEQFHDESYYTQNDSKLCFYAIDKQVCGYGSGMFCCESNQP